MVGASILYTVHPANQCATIIMAINIINNRIKTFDFNNLRFISIITIHQLEKEMNSLMLHNIVEINIKKTIVKDKDNGDAYLTKDIILKDANGNETWITCFSPDCTDMCTKIEEIQESYHWD